MRGFIQHGGVMEVVATAAIKSGDIVAKGDLVGVAIIDAAIGETATVSLEGVVSLPKKATEVWAQGDKLYVAADNTITKTDDVESPLPFIGHAFNAAVANDANGNVKLRG